jgi:hypothetical protein
MKLKFWILFVLVQIVGFTLPFFANVHSNPAPLILGPCLLLPGSVAAFIFPNLPTWLLTWIIAAVNASVWLGVSKFRRKAVNCVKSRHYVSCQLPQG